MTYKEHTGNLKKAPTLFRDGVRKMLGDMPLSTFYKKMDNDSFTQAEKLVIANYLRKPMEELFPCNNKGKEKTSNPEQKICGDNGKTTFQGIYNQKKEAYPGIRDKIRELLGMSLSTYYLKLEKNGFSSKEKNKIAQCVNMPTAKLFP